MLAYRSRRHAARAAKLARLITRPAYWRGLCRGVAASVEHERVRLPVEPRTVLDVGASRGQFALVAARRWPQARLICFEPLPDAARTLAGLLASMPAAEVRDVALSELPGVAALYVSRADDSSSLLPIAARQSAAFPGTEEVGVIDVRTNRLDTEVDIATLDRPILLKVDVQGGELRVLRGGTGILKYIDAVLAECSFAELYEGQPLAHEVVDYLREHGLVITGAGTPIADAAGRIVQIDLVFGRPPR
jgi:FkbM family methyltransferase